MGLERNSCKTKGKEIKTRIIRKIAIIRVDINEYEGAIQRDVRKEGRTSRGGEIYKTETRRVNNRRGHGSHVLVGLEKNGSQTKGKGITKRVQKGTIIKIGILYLFNLKLANASYISYTSSRNFQTAYTHGFQGHINPIFQPFLHWGSEDRPVQVNWGNLTVTLDEVEISLDRFRNCIKCGIFFLNIIAFCNTVNRRGKIHRREVKRINDRRFYGPYVLLGLERSSGGTRGKGIKRGTTPKKEIIGLFVLKSTNSSCFLDVITISGLQSNLDRDFLYGGKTLNISSYFGGI